MKSQVLIAVMALALAGIGLVSAGCSCKECTCTSDEVCEAPRPVPSPTCKSARGNTIPNVYEEDDGTSVFSFQQDSTTSWADAVKKCQDQGFTHLATLDSPQTRQFLDDMQGRSGFRGSSTWAKQWWTSWHRPTPTAWVWEPSGSTDLGSIVWEAGQPDHDCKNDCCGSLSSNTKYNDAPCGSTVYRICQAPLCKPTKPTCKKVDSNSEAKRYDYTDGYYVFSIQADVKTTWPVALKKCQAQGFDHLASTDTDGAMQKAATKLTESGYKSATPYENMFWLSFNALNATQTVKPWDYTWEPRGGTTFKSTWWEAANPDYDGRCGGLSSNGKLNDASCEVAAYRVCQAILCGGPGDKA